MNNKKSIAVLAMLFCCVKWKKPILILFYFGNLLLLMRDFLSYESFFEVFYAYCEANKIYFVPLQHKDFSF